MIRGVSEIEVKQLKSNSKMKIRSVELELEERGVEDTSVIKAADHDNWKTLLALLLDKLKTEIRNSDRISVIYNPLVIWGVEVSEPESQQGLVHRQVVNTSAW